MMSSDPESDAALLQAIATRHERAWRYEQSNGIMTGVSAGILISKEERDRICALLTARTAVIDAVARVIYEFEDDEIFMAANWCG